MERPKEETFAEFALMGNVPLEHGVMLQQHVPVVHKAPYHFHPSIELNYLTGCEMTYSFSGRDVQLLPDRLCVFWAAHPHRVQGLSGDGHITNAYVTLTEFLKWPLPASMVNLLIGGGVICAQVESDIDAQMAARWARETDKVLPKWHKVHLAEIRTRLMRLAAEGWDVMLQPSKDIPNNIIGGNSIAQFERMLRFIANNFAEDIKVADVAREGDLSPSYAISLFKRILGASIKDHIIDMRIFHAKMLLVETDVKITTVAMDSGFMAQSTFYHAFQKRVGTSPAEFRETAGRTQEAS